MAVVAILVAACDPVPDPAIEPDRTAPDPPARPPPSSPDPPPEPLGSPAPPHESVVTCASLVEGHAAAPVRSTRLRRHPYTRYAVTDELFRQVSVTRLGDRLRVRWWLRDRDCELETEIVRVDGLVLLRERRPTDRCLDVAATSVQTVFALDATDRRFCFPGRDDPIALEDLGSWSSPLTPPPRGARGTELLDPWGD